MNKGLQKIYSQIPKHYELINHIITLGLDIISRRRAAKIGASGGGETWLDMCTGTGETAVYLSRLKQNGTSIYAADFSLPMVQQAKQKREARDIPFVISDAAHLPFESNTVDLIHISFATRNINITREKLIEHFREFHRILKPGGRFINLETSQPKSKLLRSLMHFYVRLTVKPIGKIISGNKAGYAYLSNSILRFYPAEELVEILKEAGFADVWYKRMFSGITAVHKAVK
jgi:demethylmenaquinone methyltransferase / 2-methoxy-6-polyprenyl-1,4-benzoquinol methylase